MAVSFLLDLPGWDPHAGGMKSIWHNPKDFPRDWKPDEEDAHIRPTDYDLWRKNLVVHGCNHDQWEAALSALEADPNLWIFVPY